jgi:hypothetical protein
LVIFFGYQFLYFLVPLFLFLLIHVHTSTLLLPIYASCACN